MRPDKLFSLFAEVTALPGIGKRLATLVEKLAGPHVVDLCWHLPASVIDRSYQPKTNKAEEGRIATLSVTVDKHLKPASKRLPYRVRCSDENGFLTLVFFHPHVDYLKRVLPENAEVVVSGKIEIYQGEIQMTHPDHIVGVGAIDTLPKIEPVYPLTAGLSGKVLSGAIRAALERAPHLPEWLDKAFLEKNNWPSWHSALEQAHHPQAEADLEPTHPARMRLAYDELLANQLALALMRAHSKQQKGRPLKGTGELAAKIRKALPYTLTNAQERCLKEITEDLAAPARMVRLLQGDVGSGKTVVALLALLVAVENGAQGAIMAPTEILVRQHLAFLQPLCERVGIKVAVLTGREKGTARDALLAELKDGTIQILVGTHALFQEGVEFADLAVAVIDEQHRFGVHQRLKLTGKGGATDVLVMTATPIPRTLTLTAYGDMDVSRLDEKPPGRKPVDTRALPLERLEDITARLAHAIANDTRVYWVCPLVEDSELVSATAAEDRYEHLKMLFGDKVGLIHGRMSGPDKDAVMADFQAGKLKILVATTVIEVGVNVAEANIMVVEHAERFGLAQLHQLRGRVGRGDEKASCLLLYRPPLGETARARIAILRDTDDGFLIAEEDLRLRGAGDVLGTKQSGLPEFRLANLEKHAELLVTARDDAGLILATDPSLQSERGEALRTLLYLFERDEAVRYLRVG